MALIGLAVSNQLLLRAPSLLLEARGHIPLRERRAAGVGKEEGDGHRGSSREGNENTAKNERSW